MRTPLHLPAFADPFKSPFPAQGTSDKLLEEALPEMAIEQRASAINTLLQVGGAGRVVQKGAGSRLRACMPAPRKAFIKKHIPRRCGRA